MRIRRRRTPQRTARAPVSVQQEALDRVVVTHAGDTVGVLKQHIELAWKTVGSVELDDATPSTWSEQMSAGLRVIVPPAWDERLHRSRPER